MKYKDRSLKLIECVPNFSEGRDTEKIQQIAQSIRNQTDVHLLHIDAGYDANRTVMTIIGPPEAVLEAAFQSIKTASQVINMKTQSGEHPRIGATDVCPIIPYQESTMQECVDLSKRLGERVGSELNIPVYLYNQSTTTPKRENLATIRRGEYEGFAQKMSLSEWQPDFGPCFFNAESGATVIGARDFLIAYNINLATEDVKIAQSIASQIRETGYLKRDTNGTILRDPSGKALRVPGKFEACKAIGWKVNNLGCTQVSTNLTNIQKTLPHQVFEACKELALKADTQVTGSELVGMIPLFAMKQAEKYYQSSRIKDDSDSFKHAITSLGLSEFSPFLPEQRILEYALNKHIKSN